MVGPVTGPVAGRPMSNAGLNGGKAPREPPIDFQGGICRWGQLNIKVWAPFQAFVMIGPNEIHSLKACLRITDYNICRAPQTQCRLATYIKGWRAPVSFV